MHRHGLTPEVPIMLFVGGMDAAHYFKGVPTLLQALQILKKNGAPCQAVFVGDGELRPQFESEATARGLASIIRFAGRVSDTELPLYYHLADLFVLPSLHTCEAFGIVLLEAMASGVPVVASDLPGVRRVAEEAGITVPPRDPRALAAEIRSYSRLPPEKRERIARHARAVAERQYAWPILTRKRETLYQKLLEKKKM